MPEQLERVADALGLPADGTRDGSRLVRGRALAADELRFPVLSDSVCVDERRRRADRSRTRRLLHLHVARAVGQGRGAHRLRLGPVPPAAQLTAAPGRSMGTPRVLRRHATGTSTSSIVGAGFAGLYILHRIRGAGPLGASSSNAAPASAAPGTGTATRARAATSRASTTRYSFDES